jgi:hypothetical protein
MGGRESREERPLGSMTPLGAIFAGVSLRKCLQRNDNGVKNDTCAKITQVAGKQRKSPYARNSPVVGRVYIYLS